MQPAHGHPSDSMHEAQWARRLADALTAGRLAIACWLLLLGWQHARLDHILLWVMLAWSTDVLDGPLARYSQTPPSRLGQADMVIDMSLAGATAAALALAGYLPGWAVAAWTAAVAAAYWFRPLATLRLMWAAGLDLAAVILAWRHAPGVFRIFVGWALLVALVAVLGGRLRNTVGDFVAGLPPAVRHWFDLRLPRWLGGRVQQERRRHGASRPPPP